MTLPIVLRPEARMSSTRRSIGMSNSGWDYKRNFVGARQLVGDPEPVLALPQDRTRSLGVVERNSFRFFPADRLACSNGTNGTEKTE